MHEEDTGKIRVVFEVAAEPGSQVFVAGTFNDWSPVKDGLTDRHGTGLYRTTLWLPRGHHEYKFVINGIWSIDPECHDWVPNTQGSLNSVLTVE